MTCATYIIVIWPRYSTIQEKDPFAEDLNQAVKIGDVRVFLQPIAYMVEMKEQLEIIDLKGNKIGVMNVGICKLMKNSKKCYNCHKFVA